MQAQLSPQHSIIPTFQFSVSDFDIRISDFYLKTPPPPYWTKVQYTRVLDPCMVLQNLCLQGGSYMFKVRTVSRLAVLFLVVGLASTAVAAEKATPSGKVSLESTSIAAGIGVSWGEGKLTFKGKDYPFSVEGLSLVDFGISKANATGDVYNLTDTAKFAGTYVAAEAGLTLAGGMGGMVLRNANGVVLHLRSVSQGARLQLGTSGLVIKLK
jgi:hypothetical protein